VNPPEIRLATLVKAPREAVYDALTRAEELDAWFTTGAEVDPRPGGEMVWRWVDWGPDRYTGEDRGPVLEANRHERYGYPDTPEGWEQHMSCSTGWGEALTLLKYYVEHGLRY
jgi:uncharacterized protein YndB with AHSA1/START domain